MNNFNLRDVLETFILIACANVVVFMIVFLCVTLARADENRVKIAVVDTGLNVYSRILPFLCQSGEHKSFLNDDDPLTDDIQHGTNVAGLIADNLDYKKHCLVIIKVGRFKVEQNKARVDTATKLITHDKMIPRELDMADLNRPILYAISTGAKLVNLSLQGVGKSNTELLSFIAGVGLNTYFVVAAGNRATNKSKPIDLDQACNIYPACYVNDLKSDHFRVVRSYTKDLTGEYSNYGAKTVLYSEDGTDKGNPKFTGSSQATAIYTGKLVKRLWR